MGSRRSGLHVVFVHLTHAGFESLVAADYFQASMSNLETDHKFRV